MTLSSRTSSAIVVDASSLIDAFMGEWRVASAVLRHELHAPASVDTEILHGLRRAWLGARITEDEARSVLRILEETRIVRHSVEPLVQRIWALRQNITAYDAAYVALAESLDLPLITRDRRLARSAGHAARIEYLS